MKEISKIYLPGFSLKQSMDITCFKVQKVIFAIIILLTIGSCGGRDIIYVGKRYPPYQGEVQIIFPEYGMPDANTYELVARIGASLRWGRQAVFNKKLHDWFKEQAALAGGNAVIISCGEIGVVGQNSCTGDVIRFK